MNQLRYCLHCWIPSSKKKSETVQDVEDEREGEDSDLDGRSSISSSRNAPQPHLITAGLSSSVDSASPAAAAESLENGAEAAENYIALDECFSGSRPAKVQTMPKLVQRDIHLLDLVPPSPCSLMENFDSLSGMPEVYAPMSPCRISSGTPRGSLGGYGTRAVDSPNKIQQMTPQGLRRELFNFEARTLENRTGSNQSLRSDGRNNNAFFGTRDEHGHRAPSRSEFQKRILCSSISSDNSAVENRTCEKLHSLRGSPSGHAYRPHYCNICSNPVDNVTGGQNCPMDGAVECSEADGRWRPPNDGHSKGRDCPCQPEEAFKSLHMTPPTPAAQKNKPKIHKYVNARDGTGFASGASDGAGPHRSFRNCPEESMKGDCDVYYNFIPTKSHSSKIEFAAYKPSPPPLPPPCHCHSGSRKKQLKPKMNPHPKDPHRSDSVILPVRKKSTNDGESSSSNDESKSCNSLSPAASNTSLSSKFVSSFPSHGFTSKPPAPPHQLPQSIEYLQLDLDQPINGSRRSPGAIHRALNSTPIDYIKIDPFRTKALSEAKKQLESNRQNGKILH